MISKRWSHNLKKLSTRSGVRFSRSFFILWLFLPAVLCASAPDYPVYVSQIPNPNDYTVFANAGWDGNWYVGFNNAWVKKLPPIPKGHYAHVFIGAKLGRMKTLPPVGRPPEFSPFPGEIWTAIASTPSWTTNQQFRLTTTADIPFEGSPEFPLENVGESQWFWTEVPLESVNLTGDNYIALWSPTPELLSVSSSPVLAAGLGGKDVSTWVSRDVNGEPPKTMLPPKTSGVSFFQPAIALKLIPEGAAHPMQVNVQSWKNGTVDHLKPVISASVEGNSVERVWVELESQVRRGDVVRGKEWIQLGRSLWKVPYIFSLDQGKLPHGKLRLRVASVNVWGEKAYSNPFEIEVSPINAKH